MPEIGTSGLMSGDGKRGDGLRPPSYRAHPRLYHSGCTAGFAMLALMSHGQLVRADKLSLLRVGIVARHGSLRSILTFLGVGIVLKGFARADKLPLFPVWIVLRCGSFGSVFVSLGVRIILRLLRRRQT